MNDVIKTIEKKYTDKIKIEEIQDLIEQSLEKKGYRLRCFYSRSLNWNRCTAVTMQQQLLITAIHTCIWEEWILKLHRTSALD